MNPRFVAARAVSFDKNRLYNARLLKPVSTGKFIRNHSKWFVRQRDWFVTDFVEVEVLKFQSEPLETLGIRTYNSDRTLHLEKLGNFLVKMPFSNFKHPWKLLKKAEKYRGKS